MSDAPTTTDVTIWNDTFSYSAIVDGSGLHVVIDASTAVIGHVIVDSGSTSDNVTDRAGRLLGIIYGSQGQQLKQTATNYNTQVELATGATLYDARQIRALTNSDVVTVVQPTGTNLHVVNDASSAVIGHVIVDSGSVSVSGTVGVSGNVTVIQPTGTNLHVVNDASTAVIGHVITDANSVTLATTNADGPIQPGSAPTKSIIVGGIYNSAGITLTSGQVSGLQLDSAGNLKVTGTFTPATTQPMTYGQQLYWNGQGFHVTTNEITISGSSETSLFLFVNPNASGKTVRITDLLMGIDKGASTVGSEFRLYRDPTITANGTALTINKARKSQATASVCSAYSGPTASANGTVYKVFSMSLGVVVYSCDEMEIFLEANEKLLITAQPSVTGTSHSVSLSFVEV